MLHSGFIASYASRHADRGRSSGIGGGTSPTSAFSTPYGNRSAASMAAAYQTPRTSQTVHRSSPTSVMSPMMLDGRVRDYVFAEAADAYPENRYAILAEGHVLCPRPRDEAPLKIANGYGVTENDALCLPCKPSQQCFPAATVKNADSAKVNSCRGIQGGSRGHAGRRSPSHRPITAAGAPSVNGGNDGYGINRGNCGNGGNLPTPQNLRDNPERLAKVKTEMCHYYEKGGVKNCPYGSSCNYAHGKHELKFRYTTLSLMESSGQIQNAKTYLSRPCVTWVSTGACPFGRRCPSIHDPSISGTAEHPSWLPAATAKTNAQVIVDRFAAHRENSVHQENPLIAQSIWESCRPSQRGGRKDSLLARDSDLEQEWKDTYALVCNIGVPIFTGGLRPTTAPPEKISELQKLCIVHLMNGGHDSDGEAASSQDFIFAPTHSLHSELCMILQERYWLLHDVSSAEDLSRDKLVKEISFEEYESRTTPWNDKHDFTPTACVSSHLVAFGPKGDHNANVSIWFDVLPVMLEQSQIKRSRRLKQKKKTQIRHEHTRPNANGALISRTSSADFPSGTPDIEPFVPMLPAQDSDKKSHRLMMAIINHRIDTLILNISKRSSLEEEQKNSLLMRMRRLQDVFIRMTRFHKEWLWPKRVGMEHVDRFTKAPPGNIMPYIPALKGMKDDNMSPCLHTWHTFVDSINTLDAPADRSSSDYSKRLSVFLSLDGSIPYTRFGSDTTIPHIRPFKYDWWNAESGSAQGGSTWKEILLGLPENGKWEQALRLHRSREGSIDDANKPLSTLSFCN